MRALSSRFVPAADEVWRLQRGRDPECLFFQNMVTGGEPFSGRGSLQGIWIVSPSGRRLTSINSLSADKVLEVMHAGLALWSKLPARERRLLDTIPLEPLHRWESSAPAGGLVLERVARELVPGTGAADEPHASWNRDFAWFDRAEARSLLPETLEVGEEFEVPSALVLRLARFHLVDNVRGQTLPFAAEEIESASLRGRVHALEGSRVEVEYTGEVLADADGRWRLGANLWEPGAELARGVASRIAGAATFDLERDEFDAFELLAIARRWGRSQFNGRGRDASPGGIAFLFRLSPPDAPRLAPTFVALYDASWVLRPADKSELRSPRATVR